MSAPLLVLDATSALPPYEQIAAQVRAQIAAGRLAPGVPLPSVRQLARDLGVAPNTVARAYSELERAGWIETSPRRGVAVARRRPFITTEERARQLEAAVGRLLITARQLGATAEELQREIARQIAARADE